MKLTTIYDKNLNKVAILENAYKIGYSKQLNKLWTAQFSLPSTDEKNKECLPFRFVEIFDGADRVDLFRIVPSKIVKNESEKSVTYGCEHVLATLLDDVMFQYHEQIGLPTENVLNYILSQQITKRWQLGTVNFKRYFHYKWENDNLLGALLSVPKPFDKDYMWTFDTTTNPWTLNLLALSDVVNSEIRYKKNMKGITREDDPSQLCTRLYALGYGEGVNQLGINKVNPTGLPYIDADTQSDFGVVAKVFVDRRYEDENTLYNVAKSMLEKMKFPKVTYTVDGADIYQISNDTIDKFELGTVTRAIDEDFGKLTARIVGLSKSDINGALGAIKIDIANVEETIASSVASLSDRTRVNEVYAQGATNLDSHDYLDNADLDNPAVIRFFIPAETVRINKMSLTYETTEFRAYSRATKGGGGTTATSSSGGGVTTSTASGGGATKTSSSGGDHRHKMFTAIGTVTNPTPTNSVSLQADNGHTVLVNEDTAIGIEYYTEGSSGAHAHDVDIPNHTHNFETPDHSHNVTVPDHTHEIEYGIFKLDTKPTSVTVKVDGQIISEENINASEIDIIPYLSKDSGGKILRGTWHEVEIIPNDLGRISANIVSQIFVQSRGGGDY